MNKKRLKGKLETGIYKVKLAYISSQRDQDFMTDYKDFDQGYTIDENEVLVMFSSENPEYVLELTSHKKIPIGWFIESRYYQTLLEPFKVKYKSCLYNKNKEPLSCAVLMEYYEEFPHGLKRLLREDEGVRFLNGTMNNLLYLSTDLLKDEIKDVADRLYTNTRYTSFDLYIASKEEQAKKEYYESPKPAKTVTKSKSKQKTKNYEENYRRYFS